jgi:hypothetical protein
VRDSALLKYSIDDQNRLVYVNDAWTTEARDAALPDLAPPAVLGRNLWQVIRDPAIQYLFDPIFTRMRAGRIPGASYSFRCDTPTQRRLLRLTLETGANRTLDFTTAILAVQDRPGVGVLDTERSRSDDFLRICSWCKRVPCPDGQWREVEEAIPGLGDLDRGPLPGLTHGICPRCQLRLESQLDESPRAEGDFGVFGDWRAT